MGRVLVTHAHTPLALPRPSVSTDPIQLDASNVVGVMDAAERGGPPRAPLDIDAALVPRKPQRNLHHPVRLPVALFVATLGLVMLHQDRVAELFFPAGAFALALLFYWRSPAHYLGLVFWLFFLTPEVQCLAGFTGDASGAHGPIMLAPLLAVAPTGLTLFRRVTLLGHRYAVPLLSILIALGYAYALGVVRAGPERATDTLIVWLYPVMVAFYLTATWRHYPDYHRVLLKTFVVGGFVMSVVGLLEFVAPAQWHAVWLTASAMRSAGASLPFGMHGGGAMNSSELFAIMLVALLLMSFAAHGWARIPFGLVGVPALLLAGVRSAWVGLAIALVYSIAMLDGKSRRRLLAGMLGLAVTTAPLMMVDRIADPVMQRIGTIRNLADVSEYPTGYSARTEQYKTFFSSTVADIAGQGFGSHGRDVRLADESAAEKADLDNSPMDMLLVMGWPGTLLYTGGVLMLIWRAHRASRRMPHNLLATLCVGVAIAIFLTMAFCNALTSVSGLFFFVGATLPAIALRHARERRRAARRAQQAEWSPASARVMRRGDES